MSNTGSSSHASLVSVRNLCLAYGSGKAAKQVLSDLSLDILPGEVLGLVGESGCGKSTLARCIAGLLPPTSGSIELALSAQAPARGPHKVQMVFQDPRASFDPRKTLGASVTEGLRNSGAPKAQAFARAQELFARCDLPPELLDRHPHQVSGGQCQRAAIARALAATPALLIADEATSALDVTVQAQVVDLLRSLNAELGMAVLFITHDIALSQGLCTRLAVMHAGRVVECAPTEQLISHPADLYSQELIQAAQ
jgi:ABC-type dipeptide/oligopeptide/nickel transport system ATPase subunit